MKKILFTVLLALPFLLTSQTISENYVKTSTYRVPVANGAQDNIDENDRTENINYYDGLGRLTQQIIVEGAINPATLLTPPENYSDGLAGVEVDWELGEGSTPNFVKYGDTNENVRVIGSNPLGQTDILWECANNSGSGKSDGGFYSKNFPVDKNSSYIFSVWVKKGVNLSDGGAYFGTLNVSTLSGSPSSNPYFIANKDMPSLNEWYLLVGIVHPYNYTGGDTGISGIYDQNGNRIYDGVEWKWNSNTTITKMRSLFYNAVDVTSRQYFSRPVVQKLKNGTPQSFETDWSEGVGSTPFYNKNGDNQENKRVFGTTPSGDIDLLWMCDNDSSSGPDGGWNTDYFPISKTKKYRYSTWVKRTVSQNGTTYHGTQAVNDLNGNAVGNPYFWYGDLPQLNTWYLMVGVVHPYNYTGGDTGESGVYDINGNKVLDGREFKWKSTSTITRLRNYLYYSTDANVKQYFWSPQFDDVTNSSETISDHITGSSDNDIVTHVTYDEFGRTSKSFLPYVASEDNNGAFISNAEQETFDFYDVTKYLNASNPYSETRYDNSSLNRVLEQGAPGDSWKINTNPDTNHTIKNEYASNVSGDNVYNLKVNFSGVNNTTPSLSVNGLYGINQLKKSIVKDENWTTSTGKNHTTETYTNKKGQLVLKRNFSSNTTVHDTYYVYDHYGNLTYVLPPKVIVSDGVSALELNTLSYQYVYDDRNRLVEKKIPGKELEYIVYNTLDQPILTQDAELRNLNRWLFTKYDSFGRVAYSGIYNSSNTRAALQSSVNNSNYQYERRSNRLITVGDTQIYYSNSAFPTNNLNVHTLSYYDDYLVSIGITKPSVNDYGTPLVSGLDVKGLPTTSLVRVLNNTFTPQFIKSLSGYDRKGRTIWQRSENPYLNTIDVVHFKLDFIGQVLESTTYHTKGTSPAIITKDYFTYDKLGRVLTHKQQLSQGANVGPVELIAQNSYAPLGELDSKLVGGQTTLTQTMSQGLQQVDYKYNIRGWLTDINDVNQGNLTSDDLFNFKINYNQAIVGTASANVSPLYNGNISQTMWRSKNEDETLRSYGYKYDGLNRLMNGYSRKGEGLTTSDVYSMWTAYDKNGNITSMNRNGFYNETSVAMDRLTYTYNGNQLLRVNENANTAINDLGFKDGTNSGNDYTYDDNGNLLSDENKDISMITYNHFNLPLSITTSEGTISYVYDAAGTKLKKIVNPIAGSTSTKDYAGGYIYENGVLKMISHPEGYVEQEGGVFKYAYSYTDHLGNVRLTYADSDGDGTINPVTEIISEKNYYPFGLQHKGYNNVVSSNANSVAQKFKYNGKELQEELGLNWYDYGARHYDASIGRFMVIDRYSEEFEFQSPYTYAANNPVIFIDKNGDGPILGILGALAGAVVETASQVAGAVATGSSFSEAFDNLDYADIGIAAVEGGLAGLTNGASLLVTSKVADVAQAAIDVNGNGEVSTVFGGANGGDTKDLGQAAVEVVVGRTVGAGAEKLGKVANEALDKTIKKQSSNLTAKSKNLTKSNNVVANGNTNSKAKSPNAAFKEFSVAKDKVLETKSVKNAVNSKAGEKAGDVAKSVTGTAIKEGVNTVKEKIQE